MPKRNPRMVATTIETVDGWTRMVYHGTCVAKFRTYSDVTPINARDPYASATYYNRTNWREVILNTGGYATVTTKKRMNQFSKMFDLGFTVWQEKHEWYVQGILPKGNFKTKKFEGNTLELDVLE